MLHTIRVQRDDHGQWQASFEDAPGEQYGGDWPVSAIQRLVAAVPERGINRGTLVGLDTAGDALRFTVEGADFITTAAELRRRFAAYS